MSAMDLKLGSIGGPGVRRPATAKRTSSLSVAAFAFAFTGASDKHRAST
jgi:hypothetical protein